MISHLTQHDLKLKEITNKHRTIRQELVKKVGSISHKILLKHGQVNYSEKDCFHLKQKRKSLRY